MKRSTSFATLIVPFLLASCSSAMRHAQSAPEPATAAGGPASGVVSRPVSQADINFMSGMIPHHAQAVLIAGWAPSHGARLDVRTLC